MNKPFRNIAGNHRRLYCNRDMFPPWLNLRFYQKVVLLSYKYQVLYGNNYFDNKVINLGNFLLILLLLFYSYRNIYVWYRENRYYIVAIILFLL